MAPGSPRPVALVTGASSGIGAGFARALAARGHDLALVARREAPLREVAGTLERAHGIRAHCLPADLARPGAPEEIAAGLAARGLAACLLVNNAGFGVPGMLCDVPWERHRATIEVMAAAPVRLCHLLAPAMMAARSGRIVNVSSLSALLPPHAGGTLYYPVKSFLLQFSLAFHAEMRPHGVHVTAVCPGFTATGFRAAAGGTVESVAVPRWLWSEPADVAAAALRAVAANRPVCIPGLFNKMVAVAFKLAPAALGRRMVRG
ncbi:SDR family oxidoreductase [Poseidonocella sp. HB161398]|uniref:SDR family NAD(P)-dependent oxidoreductase n=1 Tax=Poseidonocella sp. HB161398 TaxID=2320855 RepID=UPI0014874951|nr:SDR family NAD(P)-dependent oxidoreductase [Poseidonocella sp. HB161398]